jgi:hypothetical protein
MSKTNVDMDELFSESGSIYELLSEIDDSLDKTMVTVFPDTSYTFRMIGPILKAKRVFIGSNKLSLMGMVEKEFRKIIEGDKVALDLVVEKITRAKKEHLKKEAEIKKPFVMNITNNSDIGFMGRFWVGIAPLNLGDYDSAIETLNKLFYKGGNWQRCIASNIFIKNSPHGKNFLRTYCLTPTIIGEIVKNTIPMIGSPISVGLTNPKISGIDAHDLTISKQSVNPPVQPVPSQIAFARNNQHNVVICPKTRLNMKEISYILQNGLYDIRKVMEAINKKTIQKMGGYYYIVDDYKLPETLMEGFNKELSDIESDMHFEEVEEQICNIDQDAIEDAPKYDGAIDSLEV